MLAVGVEPVMVEAGNAVVQLRPHFPGEDGVAQTLGCLNLRAGAGQCHAEGARGSGGKEGGSPERTGAVGQDERFGTQGDLHGR